MGLGGDALGQPEAALAEWWGRIDGDRRGDPAELLAADVRFSLTYAGKTTAGGREELMAYVRDRTSEGRRHHILMARVTGDTEIVAGELRERGRRIASFVGAAERDRQGRIRYYLVTTSPDMEFAFPGSVGAGDRSPTEQSVGR
jgi:hypothetical protein